jgi:7,8-dihydroneopterin aldolase/epimerase/oxygenase
MDIIRIHGLELECIVGLRPEERISTQKVLVDVSLGLDTRQAGRTGRIGATLDYDRVARDVTALLQFRRYRLIEVATEELALMILSAYPLAEWVELRLEKPGALAGRARAASVEVKRTRSDLAALFEDATSQAVRTRDAELRVLLLETGQTLPKPASGARVMDRLVSGQLYGRDGSVWLAGLPCPNDALDDWKANGSVARVLRCMVLGT